MDKMNKKKLSWRCKDARQMKDKNMIYQSKQWREVRLAKLRSNPLCEECQKQGYIRSAHCVHHRTPIETAKTMEQMRQLAYDWNNLVSLCDECHARIHRDAGNGTKALAAERADQRKERWIDAMTSRFANDNPGQVVIVGG